MAIGIRRAFRFASLRSKEFSREPGSPLRGNLGRDGVIKQRAWTVTLALGSCWFLGAFDSPSVREMPEILSGGLLVSDTGTGWRGCKIEGVGGEALGKPGS